MRTQSGPSTRGRFLAALAAALMLGLPGVADANEESKRLAQEGLTLFSTGKTAEAIHRFAAATLADPNDGDAWGCLGIASHRAAETPEARREALALLARARELGTTMKSVDVEIGRANFLLEEYAACLAALERFEAAQPGGWLVSEWRGLAHYHLGQYEQALERLEESLDRGSTNADLGRYYIGLCQVRLERYGRALSTFRSLDRIAPDSPYAQRVRPYLERAAGMAARGRRDKRWWVLGSVAGGFDTNTIALGDDTLISRGGDARKDAWFASSYLEAGYRLDLSEDLDVSLRAGGSRTTYDNLARANTDSTFGGLGASCRLSDTLSAHLAVQMSEFWIEHDEYSTSWSLSPYLVCRWTDWTRTLASYSYSNTEVSRGKSSTAVDPDSEAHVALLSQSIQFPGTEISVQPVVSYLWNEADGREFRYESLTAGITVVHPILWEIEGSAGFSYTRADHGERSAFSPGRTEARNDDVSTFTVRLERPIGSHFTVFVSARWSDHESNVDFYDYQRNTYALGVEFGF